MIFGSPRQALAYLYAHHRGPTLARPRYDDAPGGTGHSHWDGPQIGAMLYGPREQGGCGVVPGSVEDAEVWRWATNADPDAGLRTAFVLGVERRMRALMRANGCMLARTRPPRVRRHAEPDGTTSARLARIENSRCVAVQDVVTLP